MLTPGTIVGNDFQVTRLLKQGGMGAVYIAEQMSIGETRALKVMREDIPGLESPERREKYRTRFLEEARKSSGIRSTHVVKVVASGIDAATSTPWLAMELLHGEDLDAVLSRRRRLPLSETLVLFEQVCHGLAAAHRQGVLHLDLKPENFFVADSESPHVPFTMKVLDFGIGRVIEEQRASVTATTAVGSPLWMAPEQALRQQVSAATDVWSMGLVVYRCLTGLHYWREAAKSEDEFSPTAWIVEMMTGAFDAASTRAREGGAEGTLPPGFDGWFSRCVARDRTARWQSVDEMLAALQQIARGQAPPHGAGVPASLPAPAASNASTFSAQPPTASATAPTAFPDPPAKVATTVQWEAPTSSASPHPHAVARRSGLLGAGLVAIVLCVGIAVWGLRRSSASQHVDTAATPRAEVTRAGASVVVLPHGASATAPAPDAGAMTTLACPAGMVLIQGGRVELPIGDVDGATRTVDVRPFCIASLEVPVAAYSGCVRAGACTAERGRRCNAGPYAFDDLPKTCVSWQSAVDYCAWSGGRLPTDAEWEFAARGGGRRYPWGSQAPNAELGWSGVVPLNTPLVGTVASLDRTPDGVFDLGGNVSEWVSDSCRVAGVDGAHAQMDPSGTGRANRGGNFVTRLAEEITRRGCLDPPGAVNWVGFRCVAAPVERSDASAPTTNDGRGATDRGAN